MADNTNTPPSLSDQIDALEEKPEDEVDGEKPEDEEKPEDDASAEDDEEKPEESL